MSPYEEQQEQLVISMCTKSLAVKWARKKHNKNRYNFLPLNASKKGRPKNLSLIEPLHVLTTKNKTKIENGLLAGKCATCVLAFNISTKLACYMQYSILDNANITVHVPLPTSTCRN